MPPPVKTYRIYTVLSRQIPGMVQVLAFPYCIAGQVRDIIKHKGVSHMKIAGFNTEFEVQINGTRYFPGAKCTFPGGRFIVHTQPVPGGSADDLEVSLTVRNTGTEPFRVDEIILLHTEDPVLDGIPSSDWYIYRQGRHKNDLPAIARLSDDGPAFKDLRTTLQETGLGADTIASRIESDTMTLLSDSAERNLLLTYETSEDLLVETRLYLSADHEYRSLESVCLPQVCLNPGAEIVSEVLRISFPKDPWEAIDAWAARKAARLHARKTSSIPSVFCTWYYYGLTVSEDDVRENLQACLDRSLPFDVYQIDEGWERVLGDWRPNAKFSSGMAALADKIREAGMAAGIWTSPFIAHETAPVTSEHPDWFLKNPDGEWCLFPMNDTVYRVLDITVPEAVEWAADLYSDLRKMGYSYHKLDFTRAAILYPDAVRHDPTVPMAKAYREAIAAIRQKMGEDAYFLMCGGLYDPLIGLVDAQRTGSDVKSMWSVTAGPSPKTIPYTSKQNLLRYYFSAFWDADPDALMLRRRTEPDKGDLLSLGLLTDDEAMTNVMAMFLGCGLCCDTEKLIETDKDRLLLLRHVMPVHAGTAHPRYLFSSERYPKAVDIAYPDYHLVALLNWSDTEELPAVFRLDSELLGAYAAEYASYTVSDFFSGSWKDTVTAGSVCDFGLIRPHACGLYKIQPAASGPSVVTSDAHFSMGKELVDLSIRDGSLHFALNWGYNTPAHYGIRIPESYSPGSTVGLPVTFEDDGLVHITVPGKGNWDYTIPLVSKD